GLQLFDEITHLEEYYLANAKIQGTRQIVLLVTLILKIMVWSLDLGQ
ncbi:9088_t:CDS:1, partial [Entrophospora sp. SA101]